MIKSYVINLDKDTERLEFFSKNFKRLDLNFNRISAVDGRNFSEQDYLEFMQLRPRNNKYVNESWGRGQMGCFLSHFMAWQLIAHGTEEYCAIFEDDVHISDDLKNILDDDSWIPNGTDIIRLETSTNRVRLGKTSVVELRGRKAQKVMSTSWNAGAYILSKNTAKKLVSLASEHHQPSDALLFNFEDSVVTNQLQILQFCPAPCTQDKYHQNGNHGFASNIEFGKDLVTVTAKFKKHTFKNILHKLLKSTLGYKRIRFEFKKYEAPTKPLNVYPKGPAEMLSLREPDCIE